MRAVVQRVTRASVSVEGEVVGSIGNGLCVLVGVEGSDESQDAQALAQKVAALRVFEDAQGRMNLDLRAVGGSVLAVSQFTLLGDVRRGNRPSFTQAMEPDRARALFDDFCSACRGLGFPTSTGIFRAHMAVDLVNDGPVTILVDTKKVF